MMVDQEKAIKKVVESMNIHVQPNHFTPINVKTKNLGDRRFDIEKDIQGKIFDYKSSLTRRKCGLSDTSLVHTANEKDIDFIVNNVDWSISKKLGYDENGIIESIIEPKT